MTGQALTPITGQHDLPPTFHGKSVRELTPSIDSILIAIRAAPIKVYPISVDWKEDDTNTFQCHNNRNVGQKADSSPCGAYTGMVIPGAFVLRIVTEVSGGIVTSGAMGRAEKTACHP